MSQENKEKFKKGRFRCCHGLVDIQQPDSIKLAAVLLEQQLFLQQSSSYTPSGQEIPEWVRDECRCEIVKFTEALLRDELNMNRTKFLIVVKFGAFMRNNDDDSEMEEEKEDKDEAIWTTTYNDDYSEIEEEDMDGETLMEAGDQIGFVPASKSSIEALQKVSGLGNNSECMICLGKIKGEESANRMPCGHVYHGDCIVEWLEKSHLCPLCRYAMPIDECINFHIVLNYL
ncbi:RING-H2 finger protein ATL54-like [Durio zibethinus]|uniref:RING-type E3 ubiquitin transferase n=1 Tax=Durio zibethinus TaxID=66656 RepID=A0A6P5YC13_DURZI|nr:RING-H2 finger protein ATL54-like [Durio zibethinus]